MKPKGKSKKSSKPGRPLLPKGEAREKNAQVRCTPEEYAKLKEKAEREGSTFSDWAREVLLKAAAK